MNHKSEHLIHSWKLRIEHLITEITENTKLFGALCGVVIIVAGGWYGYRYWTVSQEEAAHTILTDCFTEYEQALQGKAQWADVALMCRAGYEKFSRTNIAPYMLAIEVDALLAQQKNTEALNVIDQMIARIGSSSLYSLYALKRALMQIDMSDDALVQMGVKTLEQLAADSKNTVNDAAQFYLGYYYRAHNDEARAKEIWQQLVAINDALTDDQARSPWAELAREKMGGLRS